MLKNFDVLTLKNSNNLKKQYPQLHKDAVWKEIPYYENYLISNEGKIFSLFKKKMLSSNISKNQVYEKKTLVQKGICKKFNVSTLVYNTFIGKKDEMTVIDHINRIPSDNSLINLREVSRKENALNCDRKKRKQHTFYQYSANGEFQKEWSIEALEKSVFSILRIRNCSRNGKVLYSFLWRKSNWCDNTEDFYAIINKNANTFSKYKISKTGIIINSKNEILTCILNKDGRYSYRLTCDQGIIKTINRYVLVASTFLTNSKNYPQVHHIDGNQSNDSVENLMWVTNRQNQIFSSGKKVYQVDINTNQILKTFDSISCANRSFGKKSKHPSIGRACTGKQLSAFGFMWRYVKITI